MKDTNEMIMAGEVETTRLWSVRKRGASDNWLKPFWIAFNSVTERLGNDLFCSKFPSGCRYDGLNHKGGWQRSAVNSIIQEYIAGATWPVTKSIMMDDVFDYVEFFYLQAEWPTSYEPCGWDDENCPVTFDESAGRERYEREVNILFDRFSAPYRLVNGRITRALTSVVEEIVSYQLDFGDQHLNDLVKKAINAFRDRQDRRIEAAMLIASAFEHWKSLEDKDFKKSTNRLVEKLANSDVQKEVINSCMLQLTSLSHNFFRHSRKESPSVQDPDFAECYFVVIFSALTFGHKRYSAELRADNQNGGSVPF